MREVEKVGQKFFMSKSSTKTNQEKLLKALKKLSKSSLKNLKYFESEKKKTPRKNL